LRLFDADPRRIAIRFEGREIRYGELDERVRAVAAALGELGVRTGVRVAHLGFNGPAVLELLYACARLGAIYAPLNWRLTAAEHREVVRHCTPRLLVADRELESQATEIGADAARVIRGEDLARTTSAELAPAKDPSAPLLLVHTSGATGRPKGVLLTAEALHWNALNSIAAHDLAPDDHVLNVLPMFHVGGLNIHTTPALQIGARVTLHARFDAARALRAIDEERPTLFLAVPQVAAAMTSHPHWAKTDVSSLRLVAMGSSTIPLAVIRPWHDRGVPVTQVYGLTESAPIAICLRREDSRRKIGSCGTAAAHSEARVVDGLGAELPANQRGEIELRGPNLFREYWGDPAATAAAFTDGWFRTGDIGHRDADGFFYVDDRKKEMVISGGENVYPAEVENVLADCDAIAEAAVVGRADERWGEVLVAFVVPAPGSGLTVQRVMRLFAGRIARFKQPREIVFVERLPRNVMGKVLKDELRARLRSA